MHSRWPSGWAGHWACCGWRRAIHPKRRRVDAGLVTLGGCLLGARFIYVLLHWHYFSSHRLETIQFWRGGLSLAGAIVGGVAALLVIAGLRQVSPLKLADALAPMIPPLAVSAWLGCWQTGCAYGALTPYGAWWGVPTGDESGLVALRFPLQLVGAFSLLAYFWWLEKIVSLRRDSGQMGSLAGVGLSLNLLLTSPLRADPAPDWYGLRLDDWAAAVLCIISLASAITAFLSQRLRKGASEGAEPPTDL